MRWRPLLLGALGTLTFLIAHAIVVRAWQTWFAGGDGHAPWFMNSAAAVAFTAAACTVVNATIAAAFPHQRLGEAIAGAAGFSFGAAVVMAILLFRLPGGPGTLFPIAIVIGTVVIAGSSVAGAAAGWWAGSVLTKR